MVPGEEGMYRFTKQESMGCKSFLAGAGGV